MSSFEKSKIGSVERFIYELREEAPIVIPQIDPDAFSTETADKLLSFLQNEGIRLIAIGGTLVDPHQLNALITLATQDYDMRTVIYPSEAAALTSGIKDRTAIYWMRISNATNPYFLTDFFVMNSLLIKEKNIEPIPTEYVFDDRGGLGSASWLARAWPIPRNKPQIALALALGAEYSGSRFFILAGGSGASLPPSYEMVKLIKEKTNLFLIPTSGIRTTETAANLFKLGADAIHVGKILESKNNWNILSKIISLAKKYRK